MKKSIFIIILIIFLTTSFLSGNILDPIINSAVSSGVDVISNPDEFLIEINNDISDTSSSFLYENYQIHFSLLWNFTGFLNAQIKGDIYKGGKYFPLVITPGISYYNALIFKVIPEFNISMSGYTPFITFSRKMKKDFKFFGGVKYTAGSLKFSASDEYAENYKLNFVGNIDLNNTSTRYGDVGLYMGLNYLRSGGKEIVTQIGYYPSIKKIFSKIQMNGRIFSFGLSFYPDSYMLVHIFFNANINM